MRTDQPKLEEAIEEAEYSLDEKGSLHFLLRIYII